MTGRLRRILVLLTALGLPYGCPGGAFGQSSKPVAKPDAKTRAKAAPPQAPWTLDCVEDFPALIADGEGTLWIAVIARPVSGPEIRVYAIAGNQRRLIWTFQKEGIAGLDRPALAPRSKGCVVAFASETEDRWRLAYAFLDGTNSAQGAPCTIDAEGQVNVKPALAAAGPRFHMVWESNAGSSRSIYACAFDAAGPDPARCISDPNARSGNPAVVALDDGSVFAAWDSVREQSADLYGAWYRKGQWAKEQVLTRDPRIERHVSLAAHRGHVWLTWQAQSFKGVTVNNVSEQRIVVARLDSERFSAPVGLFDVVSKPDDLLLRPRIGFDDRGRLWLTARQSMGQHAGWQPMAWCYSGKQWSAAQALSPEQGCWRPVEMALSEGKAAAQRDDQPRGWSKDVGIAPDWHSEVMIVPINLDRGPAEAPLETEPLVMPPTGFNLANHMQSQSVGVPSQSCEYRGQRLHCYWGDLHEHTERSVCNRAMNPPADDLLQNLRDIEQADFTAITDHCFNFDRPLWEYNGERTRIHNDSPRFVALLGQEWTSHHVQYAPKRSYRRYGHRNLIYKDSHFGRWFDAYDGDITPTMLWNLLEGSDYVCIPHQLADTGNCPTDWSFHNEVRQTVAEIFQARGSYEHLGCPRQAKAAMPEKGHYLQDAWEDGLIIGVIASPDHGGGAGRAGVWAERLDNGSVVDALLARHTFGTTGAKFVLLVRSGDAIMGDKVVRSSAEPIAFSIQCATDRPISRVVLLRNNKVIHDTEPGQSSPSGSTMDMWG